MMYIEPFWCGALATVGAELVALITYAIVSEARKGGKK